MANGETSRLKLSAWSCGLNIYPPAFRLRALPLQNRRKIWFTLTA